MTTASTFHSAPEAFLGLNARGRSMHSWQQVHQLLGSYLADSQALPDLLGFSIYYYCVFKAFGQAQHAALAQTIFNKTISQLQNPTAGSWLAQQLNHACMLAWLNARFSEHGLVTELGQAYLTALDPLLQVEALRLVQQSDANSQTNFYKIVRYYSVRLPLAIPKRYLNSLLVVRMSRQVPSSCGVPTTIGFDQRGLGLVDGLSAELLLLIKILRLGVQEAGVEKYIRQGILHLLSTKREVDFTEQKYSVFPALVPGKSEQDLFTSELNWHRGDIGPVLLLYEANKLLEDSELAKMAELVGLNTLLRTSGPATAVSNSQLYEGAAGIAHLYRKLYQASGQPAYRKGYSYWLTQTHEYLRNELVTHGYQSEPGSLPRGLVGVGLVLLSAIAEPELGWDAMLL